MMAVELCVKWIPIKNKQKSSSTSTREVGLSLSKKVLIYLPQ